MEKFSSNNISISATSSSCCSSSSNSSTTSSSNNIPNSSISLSIGSSDRLIRRVITVSDC